MKTLQNVVDDIEVWDEWRDKYRDYVQIFIKEAATGKNWKEWDENIFDEFFEKSSNQCVSSLQQGYFTLNEKERIKENWNELAPLLSQIAVSQNKALFEVYIKIKETIRKYTDRDRKAATNRLIAGLQPNILCTIVNENKLVTLIRILNKTIDNCDIPISWDWFKDSNAVWQYFIENLENNSPYENITLPWQTYEHLTYNKPQMSQIKEQKSDNVKILQYKKQIILQGPPGTGKTREAIEIAKSLIINESYVGIDNIFQYVHIGESISNSSGKLNFYTVKSIDLDKREFILTSNNAKSEGNYAKFSKIVETIAELNDGKTPANKNGQHPYEIALAKHIISKLDQRKDFEKSEQFKLIQFHPSYTYEDFVRGITATPNPDGEGIVYEAVNKTIVQFANKALKNYNDSKNSEIQNDYDRNFDIFVSEVLNRIDEEQKYMISDKVYIYLVDNNRFKYKGDNWTAHPNGLNMNFAELKKIISLGLDSRQDINKNESLNSLTRQHATYYYNVVNKYKEFIYQQPIRNIYIKELKNFVLIIDEINRANLSSVLGELIYGLEYRGKEVNSMYEVDGSQKFILPPNLYIIGTMNTADRSVGHIDYAIRRRFAFIDILPVNLKETSGLATFDDALFNTVSGLFDTNLCPEFEKKDVQLGHSYFIDKSEEGGSPDIRLNYEIRPILFEYVKDGVLIGEGIVQKIRDLKAAI
nr:AAA family ATPase [uncultured Chryseobacterium sp.]